jgi:hypothetical protein
MGYLVSGEGAAFGPAERRTDTALAALRAVVAYLRVDHVAPVRDDADQRVSLPGLLAEALWEAEGPTAERQLISVLADYVETSLRPWADTVPYEDPPETYWRHAGWSWASGFKRTPLKLLLDELARRYSCPRIDELWHGVNERLPRYLALPTSCRGQWGVWDGQTDEFRHLHFFEGVAVAHAEALNAGRPWTDEDQHRARRAADSLEFHRRTARARQASTGAASPPAPTPASRPRSGRRP